LVVPSSTSFVGVSGFIAGWVAKLLSERNGYVVRGTVRDLNSAEKVKHLRELLPKVQLFQADLVKEGTFDEATKGVDIVFHTASPFQLTVADPVKDLVEPALQGTLNVLRAVQRAGTVKRVVLTSSVAAVISSSFMAANPDHAFTEEDWNNTSTIEAEAYRYSKVEAEKAAWAFAKEHKIDLVTICPSFVLGPPLSARTDSTSVATIVSCFDGSKVASGVGGPVAFGAVDVRDVAEAHILAAEKKEASGRYIVSSERGYSQFELVHVIRQTGRFNQYPLPTKETVPVKMRQRFNLSKVKALGVQFRPIEVTLIDMAEALIKLGVIKKL